MIKTLTTSLVALTMMGGSAVGQEIKIPEFTKYVGFQGGVGNGGAGTAGFFTGIEAPVADKIVAGGEVAYNVGANDTFNFDGIAGYKVLDNVTTYGKIGYGTGNAASGLRYGGGVNYDIDDVYRVGVEGVFQDIGNTTVHTIMGRAMMKF